MKIHFLGIGGSGQSAVAAIAKAQGFEISGCDLQPLNEFTQSFDKEILQTGHSPEHLEGVDILAITPAILSLDPNNPELLEAQKKGIKILTWQQFLGKYLTKDKFVIAVCGTHGKSTTTAMIGLMLEDANLDPTVELGAIVPKWKANFRVGKSKYFVVEADEFNDNFLPTKPDIAVVTNIEMDHPEYFKNFEDYQESFKSFLSSTKIKIFANLSDPVVQKILALHPGGINTVIDYSKNPIDFPLKVLGDFNKLNASAAYQVGLILNLDPTQIRNSLMSFQGIGRRMEYLGEFKQAKIYTDFAHHPTEVKVTIEAIRKKFPDKRLLVVFQPHMFSRTLSLFEDFVKVFKDLPADQVFLVDIYPSREVDTGVVTSKLLAQAISKNTVSYLGSTDQSEQFMKVAIREGDLVIFMGAGDIDRTARKLIKDL